MLGGPADGATFELGDEPPAVLLHPLPGEVYPADLAWVNGVLMPPRDPPVDPVRVAVYRMQIDLGPRLRPRRSADGSLVYRYDGPGTP
jgi:hypothetical protein